MMVGYQLQLWDSEESNLKPALQGSVPEGTGTAIKGNDQSLTI